MTDVLLNRKKKVNINIIQLSFVSKIQVNHFHFEKVYV